MTLRRIVGRAVARASGRGPAVRPRFSLAHLTVIRLAPPQVIEVAARTGYDTVGLRLIGGTEITPAYPLMDDKPLMRATKAAMAATGVGVLDIEFVRITPEIDVSSLEPFAAAGAELGARYMITSAYDPDLEPVHGPAGRDQRLGFAVRTARGAGVLSVDSGS